MQANYTQACVILQEYAQVTANISASTPVGNITAHGGQMLDSYVVYARIVAQAADEGTATALAKSVVVTTSNSTISASPDHVDAPQSLSIDFEIFTAAKTNLTLTTRSAGNLAVDGYNSVLQLTASQVGNVSLKNVQGQADVEVGTGSIDVTLTGSGWTGPGMTASTQQGNVSLSRPATYQAAFTAESDLGTASIDGKQASTVTPGQPAVVTAGSGPAIMLKSLLGSVSVTVATQ
jgi:hypothetical protein